MYSLEHVAKVIISVFAHKSFHIVCRLLAFLFDLCQPKRGKAAGKERICPLSSAWRQENGKSRDFFSPHRHTPVTGV